MKQLIILGLFLITAVLASAQAPCTSCELNLKSYTEFIDSKERSLEADELEIANLTKQLIAKKSKLDKATKELKELECKRNEYINCVNAEAEAKRIAEIKKKMDLLIIEATKGKKTVDCPTCPKAKQ